MCNCKRNIVLEVRIARGRPRHESDLCQSRILLCYSREQVKREEKEILQHQESSPYIHFICLPQIILHAVMYHPNSSRWSYTPPYNSLSTKSWHIIGHPNTSDYFRITTNYTATTAPHFRMFTLCLPKSTAFHNTVPSVNANQFLSIIPTYH